MEKVNEMTITEYAMSRHVSYEAVRKQLILYKKDLKSHIRMDGKRKMLDPEAVDFLDKHRLERNVIITPTDEQVQKEIQVLVMEKDRLQTELQTSQDKLVKLHEEHEAALVERTEYKTKYELQHDQVEEMTTMIESLRAEIQQLKDEAAAYRPSILGFYRKAKQS